jgi:hypothetical protein
MALGMFSTNMICAAHHRPNNIPGGEDLLSIQRLRPVRQNVVESPRFLVLPVLHAPALNIDTLLGSKSH